MTKKLLKDALIELMDAKPFDRITVKELCSLADVNRSTFYIHYEDATQLLREIESDVLAKIPVRKDLEAITLESQLMEIFVPFFDYVRKNRQIFRVLLRSDNSDFVQRWIQNTLEKFEHGRLANDPQLARYSHIYAVHGVIGMMKEWMREDFPIDSKTFSEFVLLVAYHSNEI